MRMMIQLPILFNRGTVLAKMQSDATHTLNTHMIGACIFRQSLCFQTELQEYKNTTICPMNLNFGKKRVEEPEGASKKEEQKDPL